MEALALEISKILNITLEKAIELMPVIREQFIRYSVLQGSQAFIVIMAISLGIASYVSADMDCYKAFMVFLIFCIIFILLFALSMILPPLIAPDFMMLQELML